MRKYFLLECRQQYGICLITNDVVQSTLGSEAALPRTNDLPNSCATSANHGGFSKHCFCGFES